MNRILIAGIDTDVGKTVASAIVTTLLSGEYWKPIQSGDSTSDSKTMRSLVPKTIIHPSAYSFKAPLSPHHAAQLEQRSVEPASIKAPTTESPLIIEMAGGILTPLTDTHFSIDIFKAWSTACILVSKHYLGSINHTLLTLEALKQRGINLLGIIFNGNPNHATERVILNTTTAPLLGRIFPEKTITSKVIQRYAHTWQQSGILSHK